MTKCNVQNATYLTKTMVKLPEPAGLFQSLPPIILINSALTLIRIFRGLLFYNN